MTLRSYIKRNRHNRNGQETGYELLFLCMSRAEWKALIWWRQPGPGNGAQGLAASHRVSSTLYCSRTSCELTAFDVPADSKGRSIHGKCHLLGLVLCADWRSLQRMRLSQEQLQVCF